MRSAATIIWSIAGTMERSAGSSRERVDPGRRFRPSHGPSGLVQSVLMQLAQFLDFESIRPNLVAPNKRVLLQQLAQIAGHRLGLDSAAITASVAERERLGTTGFGNGVAIPHGKVDGLTQIYC